MENETKLLAAIEALNRKLSALEEDLRDAVEDSVEDAVESAVEDAVSSAMAGALVTGGAKPSMYVLSQDQKALVPFAYATARRIKQGEEPYAIWVCYGQNNNRLGIYPNKEAALAEMRSLADAVQRGASYYEMH